MIAQVQNPSQDTIIYPDSDGKPMADNTLQFHWIVMIKLNLDSLFVTDPAVFVAGDLLWYPVEGNSKISQAPDVMVAFGRPKGYRGSYIQHREANIPPQVVFEILSPNNTQLEMEKKWLFYDRYGVEEYYLYDPDHFKLEGWIRSAPDQKLEVISSLQGWSSPRLGIRFEPDSRGELILYYPDGAPFEAYEEVKQRAEQERQRAEQEYQRAEQERQRVERLTQYLRELGVDPDQI